MDKQQPTEMPKLVGTNFVKMFREFILSLIQNEELKEIDIVRKAFLQHNVKSDTTKKYISEMIEMKIIRVDEKEVLRYNL